MRLPDPSLINRKTPSPSGPSGFLTPQMISTPRSDTAIGDALQSIGDDAYKYAMAEKARMDDVVLDDGKNQLQLKALELENEYSQIRKKDAFDKDIVKDYSEKLRGISEKISAGFKNESQKKAWESYFGKAKVQFTAGVMKHKINESDAYAVDTYNATNLTRIQTAHSNWADSGVVNESAADIVRNISKEKLRAGWGDDRTEAELKSALGPLWSGVAAQYINAKQYNMARKILDQNQDVIGVDKYTSFHKSIEASETIDLSQEHADRIFNSGKSFEEQLKEARSSLSGHLEDETVKRIKELNIEKNVQAQLEEKRLGDLKKSEEQNIGNMYLSGDYGKAYKAVQLSKVLTGDEKRLWGDAIEKKATEPPPMTQKDKTDLENKRAIDIININEMIANGSQPEDIQKYILFSNLDGTSKEQYINKTQTNLDSDLKDGRSLAYGLIRDTIIPKRGALSNILETPLENAAVASGQNDFDLWLERQVKEKKYPTREEIRQKAIQISKDRRVPLAEQMEYMKEESKRLAEEAKAAKAGK